MESDLASNRSLDELFSVLAHTRRRHVLTLTGGRRGGTDVTELARSIAERERDREHAEPQAESVRSIAVALHHVHLPKLAAAGLIEYDCEEGVVASNPLPGRLDAILETATRATPEVKAE